MTNIALALLATVAGMFLLAKAQKDNLGGVFKGVAYGVITVGLLGFLCGLGCGISKVLCSRGGSCTYSCSQGSGYGEQCCSFRSSCGSGSRCGHGWTGSRCSSKSVFGKCSHKKWSGENPDLSPEGGEKPQPDTVEKQ